MRAQMIAGRALGLAVLASLGACTAVTGLADYEKCYDNCGASDAAVEAPPPDFSGLYLASCIVPSISSAPFFQRVDLKVNVAARTVDYQATWLKTGSTKFSSSSTSGPTLTKSAVPIVGQKFTVSYGSTIVPADCNPVSSMAVAMEAGAIEFLARVAPCGELSGKTTSPVALDLSAAGDVCILTPTREGDPMPTVPSSSIHCP